MTAAVLKQAGDLLATTDDTSAALPDPVPMERQREACAVYHRSRLPGDYDSVDVIARQAFHAQVISIAVQALVADTLIATRRADPETVTAGAAGTEPSPRGRWPNGASPGCPARSASSPGTRASARSGCRTACGGRSR